MLEIVSILVFFIVLTITYYVQCSRSRRNLPPFPAMPLPLVGNLLSLGENPRPVFARWRKEHGDIYSLYLGQTLVIVLNGYDVIKEALVKYGDYFSDRPLIFIDQAVHSVNEGVILSSGKNWNVQRTVSTSILRSLGMGKNILAEKILEEAKHYRKSLSEFQGQAVDIEPLTHMAMSNVICAIVEGKRRDYDDIPLRKLIGDMIFIATNLRGTNPLNFYPSLYHLPGDPFRGKAIAKRIKEMWANFRYMYITQKEYVKANDDEEPACFVDAYLRESAKRIKKNGTSDLDDKNLVRLIFDFYTAGTETTSTTILWFIIYMVHYPQVQAKIHQEIDSEIGTHRFPSMQDKPRLGYLNATIMEVQRIASVVPLSVMHAALDTVTFKGYIIPKGANIAPNLDSVLLDSGSWGPDVYSFRPERHLDKEGKVIIRDEFVPFSVGRRICLGESLARMEIFLFLTSMLQRFTVKPESPDNLPSLNETFGITAVPQRFKIRMLLRED